MMTKRKTYLLLSLILLSGALIYLFSFPDISVLKTENPKKTSFMEFKEKEWKKEKGKNYKVRQRWVSFSNISPYLIKAVLIAEDDRFFSHEGFDYEAMKKAIEKDIKAKRFKFGGSTITQQLAKNLYLSPSKNPTRKLREAIITWRIERTLSKKRILEIYLNVVEWGEGIFGAESASNHYYGKTASQLTPEEASRLASVLPNPRRYNPLSDSGYVARRADLILSIMVKRGIVLPEYEGLIEEPIGQKQED